MEAMREYETLVNAIKAAQTIPSCMQTDPDLFYSDKNETDTNRTKAAKKMCQKCPVVNECAIYAIAAREMWGVWGGMSPNDRKTIWRSRRSLGLQPK
jgi:WhiB family redox-sensing transcriptional regulator